MATSKSTRKGSGWIAGAYIFSGRPDPTWSISEHAVKTLQELWESLPAAGDDPQLRPPALGYRGSFLRGTGNREWMAFNGLVSLRTSAGVQFRKDVAQQFERALLSSAPNGLLPEGVIEGAWSRK